MRWGGLSRNDLATPGSCHFQDGLFTARRGDDIIRDPEKDDNIMVPFLHLAGTLPVTIGSGVIGLGVARSGVISSAEIGRAEIGRGCPVTA